jgi:hypothetical protein
MALKRCPPPDAVPCGGTLFRYICNSSDWATYLQRGKVRADAGAGQKCRGAALSCWLSLESLRNKLSMRENLLENCTFVQATLAAEHGVIKPTSGDPSHVSLWLKRRFAASPNVLFSAVGEPA